MRRKKILILDYSISRVEAPAIKSWMPTDAEITALPIGTEKSFPLELLDGGFTHVIHSGSEYSIVNEEPFTQNAVIFIQETKNKGIPQMGICYGHQLLSLALVGRHAVRKSPNGFEAGWKEAAFTDLGMNILGVRETETVWQHHFDEVTELPAGSELIATNPHTEIQAYINTEQRLFGTQFHPEFDLETGNAIYLQDRALIESHHYKVEELVKAKPSIDTGKIFFEFFLELAN